ncbi:hypothetical protein BT63DRAFT_296017 [Microthyrium microscopicum]|uniref:Nephrocystin 3-like N-terminal domain-containing protein n=1 Tax=Microthyrium microscopicum TaxID=703497 RepID=A0A6A6U9N6_9PEZI|nr:hypothetical protein BT63DRAFT_296017 [Microthyrium microscopicum]
MRKYREPETCSWILKDQSWKDWVGCKTRCLWIYGIPGSGKSVLASYAVDEAKTFPTTIGDCSVYYYCYYGHAQDEVGPFLRAIIIQLCGKTGLDINTCLKTLCGAWNHNIEPTTDILLSGLAEILRSLPVIYVILDALDESQNSQNLVALLHVLATEARFITLHILVTSRQERRIEAGITRIDKCSKISMENPLLEEDIRCCVKSKLQSILQFEQWPVQLLKEVEEIVPREARGMFQWAVCQIEELKRIVPEQEAVSRALSNLPKDLNLTYRRVLDRIEDSDLIFVKHAMMWIIHEQAVQENCTRELSLTSERLLDQIRASMSNIRPDLVDRYYSLLDLHDLCGCLIRTGNNSVAEVSFSHYTVYEYLRTAPFGEEPNLGYSFSSPSVIAIPLKIALFDVMNPKAFSDINLSTRRPTVDTMSCMEYFRLFAIHSINHEDEIIGNDEELMGLWPTILDPSKPYFKELYAIIPSISSGDSPLEQLCLGAGTMIEEDWRSLARVDMQNADPEAMQLLCIILLTNGCLAERFLAKHSDSYQRLLKIHFKAQLRIGEREHKSFGFFSQDFVGTIFEYLMIGYHSCDPVLEWLLHFDHTTVDLDLSMMLLLSRPFSAKRHRSRPRPSLLNNLISKGANVNVDTYFMTPLQLASYNGDDMSVEVLIAARADPNALHNQHGVLEKEKIETAEPIGDNSPLRLLRMGHEYHKDQIGRPCVRESYGSFFMHNKTRELLIKAGGRDFTRMST